MWCHEWDPGTKKAHQIKTKEKQNVNNYNTLVKRDLDMKIFKECVKYWENRSH